MANISTIEDTLVKLLRDNFPSHDGGSLRDQWPILSSAIQQGLHAEARNANHSYLAFHYRDSELPEGRRSPFGMSDAAMERIGKELAERFEDLRIKYSWTGEGQERFVQKYLNSYLQSYLYVFGRRSSFSELCILRHERLSGSSQAIIQSHSFLFTDEEHRVGTLSEESFVFPIGWANSLTHNELLVKLFARAVILAMQKFGWEELNDPIEYRTVERYLNELTAKLRHDGLPRTYRELRYLCLYATVDEALRSGSHKAWVQSANRLSAFANDPLLTEDGFAVMFRYLRVVQALALFRSLLGNKINVYTFPMQFLNDSGSIDMFRRDIRQNKDAISILQRLASAFDYKGTKFTHSALAVYPGAGRGPAEGDASQDHRQIERLRVFVQSLTTVRSSGGSESPIEPDDAKEYLARLFGKTDIKFSDISAQQDHKSSGSWYIYAVIICEALVGITHEGRRPAINIAIGTDVEFREVFRPLFSVSVPSSRTDKNPTIKQLLRDPVLRRKYSSDLIQFVRENYSFLNNVDRYLCFQLDQSGSVSSPILSILEDDPKLALNYGHQGLPPVPLLISATIHASGAVEVYHHVMKDGALAKHVGVKRSSRGDWGMFFGNGTNGMPEGSPDGSGVESTVTSADLEARLRDFFVRHSKQTTFENGNEDQVREWLGRVVMPVIQRISVDMHNGCILVFEAFEEGDPGSPQHSDPHPGMLLMRRGKWTLQFGRRGKLTMDILDANLLEEVAIQDGATVFDLTRPGGEIRFGQMLMGVPVGLAKVHSEIQGKQWGTRHTSAYLYTEWVRKDPGREAVVLVVSQDGDVHWFDSTSSGCEKVRKILFS